MVVGVPFTFFSALWMKFLLHATWAWGIEDKIFMKLGVLPILDQYYQPLINPKKYLTKSLRDDRSLPGIDFNPGEQINLLSAFNYNEELLSFPIEKRAEGEFYYNNGSYCAGDAEYLYSVVRHFKPRRIIEIGCGSSTLMIGNAVAKNKSDNPDYVCQHICVEPYEQPWLEQLDIELIREKIENIEIHFFQKLEANDILFIDSTHMIRPQGDVLYEYLELLPTLKPGVLVHIHDVFLPKDYLDDWVYKHHLLWNEQYLLEAFLTFNREFRIFGALNYLSHHYEREFAGKCPIFSKQKIEARAFWMVKA